MTRWPTTDRAERKNLWADHLRRYNTGNADRARGDLWPGPVGPEMVGRVATAPRCQFSGSWPHLLELDQRPCDRPPDRAVGRSRVRLDQRGVQAFPGRAVRRREAVRYRPRGMPRGTARVHAR